MTDRRPGYAAETDPSLDARAMTRETMAERAARLRCAECGKWYMGTAQRDAHAVKVGHAQDALMAAFVARHRTREGTR